MLLMDQGYKAEGEVFTVPVLHKRITFLLGPHASPHFFKANDDEMSQKEVYEFNVPTFGPGVVFDVDHKTRAEQFRFFADALKSARLALYVPQFVSEAREYFAGWGDEGVVDLKDALAELTVMTAARTLLGEFFPFFSHLRFFFPRGRKNSGGRAKRRLLPLILFFCFAFRKKLPLVNLAAALFSGRRVSSGAQRGSAAEGRRGVSPSSPSRFRFFAVKGDERAGDRQGGFADGTRGIKRSPMRDYLIVASTHFYYKRENDEKDSHSSFLPLWGTKTKRKKQAAKSARSSSPKSPPSSTT
jgi:hypothetical protein